MNNDGFVQSRNYCIPGNEGEGGEEDDDDDERGAEVRKEEEEVSGTVKPELGVLAAWRTV